MTRAGKIRWLTLAALGLLVAGVVIPPLVNADRFASGIRSSLERELGRKVEVGRVRIHLLPTPAFFVDDVVIHENPAWGVEPAAYVTTLAGHPMLSSLWTGRLEFASLELDEPSINLVRVEGPGGATRWNFEPLLAGAASLRLPDIRIEDARINFKTGGVKSVFYFMNTRASVTPPSGAEGAWRIQIEGEPARTDRPARGFGRLQGSGRWRQRGDLDMNFQLEKSAIVDMVTLVYGQDAGVHGLCSSRLRLSGKPEDLKITGRVQLEDIHRWDMLPPHGDGWMLNLDGRLDLTGQSLELRAAPRTREAAPFTMRFRSTGYLSNPRWGVVLNCARIPLAPLVEVARHMGVAIPATLTADGEMEGALGYSPDAGLEGRMALFGTTTAIPGAPPVSFDDALVVFDGPRIELLPTTARSASDEARIRAAYYWNTRLFDIALASDQMQLASPGARAALADVPLLNQVQSGWWHGTLRCQHLPDGPAIWTGRVGLEDAVLPLPGFAGPLRLNSAGVRLRGSRLRVDGIDAELGSVAFQGDYLFDPGLPRPHRFNLFVPELAADEAEDVLAPVLVRSRGFLARTLGLGAAALPDWLRGRHAEGRIHIDEFTAGDLGAEQLRSEVVWDGAAVELRNLAARFLGGMLEGSASVDLKGSVPVYNLQYRFDNVGWRGGRIGSEGEAVTSGAGIDTLLRLEAEGSLTGTGLLLEPGTAVDEISGEYHMKWGSGAPIFDFSGLELSVGDVRYTGKGASREDGTLLIQLSDGTRQLLVSGSLAQMKVDRIPVTAP